jgi:hypothetical protein
MYACRVDLATAKTIKPQIGGYLLLFPKPFHHFFRHCCPSPSPDCHRSPSETHRSSLVTISTILHFAYDLHLRPTGTTIHRHHHRSQRSNHLHLLPPRSHHHRHPLPRIPITGVVGAHHYHRLHLRRAPPLSPPITALSELLFTPPAVRQGTRHRDSFVDLPLSVRSTGIIHDTCFIFVGLVGFR